MKKHQVKKPPDKAETLKKLHDYENFLKTYRVNKVSLQKIIKNKKDLLTINRYVSKAHRITVECMLFLKLYILDHYDKKDCIPVLNENVILQALKVVCREKIIKTKKENEIKDNLNDFYLENFQNLTNSKLDYVGLNQIINYIYTQIYTEYETNIKQNFISYINRFVNVYINKKEVELEIKNDTTLNANGVKNKINDFRSKIRLLKNDIIDGTHTSETKYHSWLDVTRGKIIPNRKLQEDSVLYDIECTPIDYLYGLIYMNREIESKGAKMFSPIPLRRDIKPKYIHIDTKTLALILLKENKSYYQNNVSKEKHNVWSKFFKTDNKVFQNKACYKYRFNHSIYTDGLGVSILLIRSDKYKETWNKIYTKRKPKGYQEDKYIDKAVIDFNDKTIVGIDPGKNTLIQCTDGSKKGNTNKTAIFRYTQNQRRKEGKLKEYRNCMENEKKEKQINETNKTIKEIETTLSKYNHKTCNLEKFKEYIINKLSVNNKLYDYYEDGRYRKYQWFRYINTQRSERRMINKFKERYGAPGEVIIGIGDWSNDKPMKNKEPTKGKSIRRLFKRSGYELYLVDEYKTSKICNSCEKETENFLYREDPREWKKSKKLIHSLLRCKTSTCNKLWNRDTNGALNILKIIKSVKEGTERPEAYRRNQSSTPDMEGSTTSPVIP